MIIRRLGLPKELLDKINSNSKLKTHFEFFATDIAAQISDGNILKKGFIDPEALEIYCQKLKSSVTDPEIASLVDIIQHSPGIHGLAITLKRADFREGLINNNRYSKKDSYYNNYDRVNNRSKLSLKYSSLLRQSLGFVDKLPDSIEGKINEFVKKYSYLDPKDCLDMMIKEFDEEEIKQNFTFDIESNPDLVEQTGKRGFDTSYFSNEEIKETGRALLSQLPDTFINIVNKTKEASQILNSLKYTEEDLKAIKPFLEKFTKTGINIPDSDLCYLLNTNTRRYSAYTHVDTETLLQSIAAYSSALKVEFLPEGHDFVSHSTDLSEALNKISTNRSEELIAKSSFENFQEMLNYDICHFAFEDLKYDDIQNALGKEEEKIKLAKAYDKLYPSQSALKSGFKFDFDALLIRMSRLKAKSQLDIYTNPINNFSEEIPVHKEKNLEVLKKEFLKDFDQSLLDSITLKNMEPIIDALITNVDPRTGQKIETATALSTHVNLMHFEEYENFINNTGKIGLDLDHPGFLTPESYKAYRELNSSHDLSDYNKSINDISSQPEVEPIQEEKVSSISVNQESNNLKNEDFQTKVTSSEDIHPAVQDAPKGVVGFISSFVKKFRSTDKESGLVNRIKESFTYANNVINDYSELDKISNSESDNYKPDQNTEAVNHEQLDSFSQSISVRDSNGNYEPKNNNNSNNKTQEDNSSRAQDDDSEINI